MQTNLSANSRAQSRHPPIQFYAVEITPLADGRVFVGVGATICEEVDDADFELVNMEMASERVDTIDQALAVIRDAVVSSMPASKPN
jgi:hypothetical protein